MKGKTAIQSGAAWAGRKHRQVQFEERREVKYLFSVANTYKKRI